MKAVGVVGPFSCKDKLSEYRPGSQSWGIKGWGFPRLVWAVERGERVEIVLKDPE